MNSARRHARIECGRQIGAGFLVTGRKVVTCAHVIADSGVAPVTVTFPHQAGAAAVPARILSHGGWGGRPTDPGDLAVLELDEDAPVDRTAPSPSARASTAAPTPRASSCRTRAPCTAPCTSRTPPPRTAYSSARPPRN
ncbi:trypsin-like peptidase domain-containing protein [Streptomyces sp. NBC_01361]|uniref:trypsin-like peptidase domain-containing protein n=1 Tax=Streptomyces sp. NBC_01361 TaxID=2903838 RepID=UPI002E377E1F|nr:trypsin-like peptidase domain-containing protein [Streptomyces sp. NBC_01361]